MKEKRRNYSPSQKVSIVRELLEEGDSLSKISEKYHIHPTQITRWGKERGQASSREEKGPGHFWDLVSDDMVMT